MAEKLRRLGFTVVEGYDQTYDEMRLIQRDFARAVRAAEVAVIYYSGHGVSVDGANYLIPVDATLDDPIDWEFQVYRIEDYLRLIRTSETATLVFLDASRPNPMGDGLQAVLAQAQLDAVVSPGLSAVSKEAGEGRQLLVASSAAPGQVAPESFGPLSTFTTALLTHLESPNLTVSQMLARVSGDVLAASGDTQRPDVNSNMTSAVMLNEVSEVAPEPLPMRPPWRSPRQPRPRQENIRDPADHVRRGARQRGSGGLRGLYGDVPKRHVRGDGPERPQSVSGQAALRPWPKRPVQDSAVAGSTVTRQAAGAASAPQDPGSALAGAVTGLIGTPQRPASDSDAAGSALAGQSVCLVPATTEGSDTAGAALAGAVGGLNVSPVEDPLTDSDAAARPSPGRLSG